MSKPMTILERLDAGELVPLDFEHLSRLSDGQLSDGQLADRVNDAIRTVLTDHSHWGKDGKYRKVVLEVAVRQLYSKGRKIAGRVEVKADCKVVLPGGLPKKTVGYHGEHGSVDVLFAPSSAGNPEQLTFASLAPEAANGQAD